MTYWRGSVDAADAKKAEDASIRVLLIRKLPKRTGRLAWAQLKFSKTWPQSLIKFCQERIATAVGGAQSV